MAKFHFLNVKNGDCSIIEHNSGHVSVIDICNARLPHNETEISSSERLLLEQESVKQSRKARARKNYGQKSKPINPIAYMHKMGMESIFRLVISHPDMDHMDGLADLFEYCVPTNYYDTKNQKNMADGWDGSPYREIDWKKYKELRDNPTDVDPKCMRIYSGDDGIHRTRNWDGTPPGDAFYTLAPTPELIDEAINSEDYNDASYVFLYCSPSGKILLSGDSHEKTWAHIISAHKKLVTDVDLLIAPHHGRKSGRTYEFLDVLNPKMTFFGNAPSKDLAYSAWRSRGLPYITNNMAGTMVIDCDKNMALYVSNEEYAKEQNTHTFYRDKYGWYVEDIITKHKPKTACLAPLSLSYQSG